jgi:queuine tRNA-ribosyltransferase
LHNLYYYLKLMVSIRQAVAEDRFAAFRRDFYEKYQNRNEGGSISG